VQKKGWGWGLFHLTRPLISLDYGLQEPNNSCHSTLLQNVDDFITRIKGLDEASSCSTTENTTLADSIRSISKQGKYLSCHIYIKCKLDLPIAVPALWRLLTDIHKTRLKRLPVISREHFRKTRTIYFYKHLLGISNTNLQNGISYTSALKKRLVF
jgi:hypothetical protein